MLHFSVDVQFDGLLGEGEHLQQDAPADEQQDDDEREHEHHPLAEAQSEVQSLGVVQVFQCNVVGRSANGGSHTAQVGSHGDGHCQGDAPLAFGRQLTEHGSEERQHHGCRSRV